MGEKTTLDYETRSEKPSRGKRFGRHVALFTLEFWLCSVLLVMGGSLLHSGNWINATTFNSLVELAMGCNG
ncbi:MAG TPA: hypothetical protein VHM90_13585, partial [Phycisphaerae bacterium]|nr:hypothetical protein [Phycisphaerae bacterium]